MKLLLLLFYAFEVVVGVAFAADLSVLCRSWSLEGVAVCPVDAGVVCAGAVISNVVVRDELLT